MIWANFLHIYQPPTQKPYWVKKIAAESYQRIFQGLLENPEARATLNINAVLLELFEQNGLTSLIEQMKELLKNKQIELTASAKFHPLLPKLPEEEIIRQIEINQKTHQKYFGDLYRPEGFFPPEMGYSNKVAKIVEKMGFKWVIVDELSFPREKGEVDYSKIYEVEGTDSFKIFFRERKMSYKILSGQLGTGNLLIDGLGERLNKNEYLLTAMDGETFGHHRPGMEQLLFEIYRTKKLKTVLISELPALFKNREKITPQPSTWALMEKDLQKNAPFARWEDPGNEIHEKQWTLLNLALESFKKWGASDPAYEEIRSLLDRAIHSDQFWWASAKPWWSLEMIEAGAKELKEVVTALKNASPETKEKAEALYRGIIFTGFEWQRSGRVETLSKQEDEEVRQLTDQSLPELPKEEIDKIVKNLKKEIALMVKREEFERAAQLRDRIKELRNYQKKE